MAKSSKKAKGPAKSAKRKVSIKDLKAKDASSVKGGAFTNVMRTIKIDDVRISSTNTIKI